MRAVNVCPATHRARESFCLAAQTQMTRSSITEADPNDWVEHYRVVNYTTRNLSFYDKIPNDKVSYHHIMSHNMMEFFESS
jgi:hypothetical protein